MDAGVGLYTRCRSYNVLSFAENNGKDCAYAQDFQSCTTSGCDQLTPPSPGSETNSTANGTLVDGDGGDSSSDASGQNTEDDKNADGSDVSAEGVVDSATEEEEAKVSTASVSMVMVGAIVAVAVCCMMGLALVYVRQKRKRDAQARSSSKYQAVNQGASRQSMLLMNPMFNLSGGKSRKSTIAMKSGARMSFLSNPLFDREEEEEEDAMPTISESPQGSDAESSELLERNVMEQNAAYSNPLYSTTKKNVGATEQSIEESMELLGKEFEASISQLSQSVVETSTGKDLEFAMHTWQKLSTTLVEATDEVITNEGTQQVNADKLHILKQSLNKIEQGTLLSGSMSTDDKSSFVKLINQARAKLRSVEKLHSYRRSRASTTTSPEWVKARQKLKAIAKFKGASKK